ncbi:hypothetical protein HK405_003641, partial [Cladochytrium tenue]
MLLALAASHTRFVATLLPGIRLPPSVLTPDDILWVRISAANGGGGGRGGGGSTRFSATVFGPGVAIYGHAASRFVRHTAGGGGGGLGPDGLPYMGGGGYNYSGGT